MFFSLYHVLLYNYLLPFLFCNHLERLESVCCFTSISCLTLCDFYRFVALPHGLVFSDYNHLLYYRKSRELSLDIQISY